jgi:predicted glycosyltransferase involved in capsule biosynthesis
MITLVLTYRNRDLRTVKRCLDSLNQQSLDLFQVVLVDYGSEAIFANPLKELIKGYNFIQLVSCPVQGQLWNKSRAINIALQQCNSPYFFVADVDMLFRKDFIAQLSQLKSLDEVIYFKVGFLSKEESEKECDFEAYNVKHYSTEEATGMSLFPTEVLKRINGYDEFYHGWGAEDTDVHVRFINSGFKVRFYESEALMLHQWHLKGYRTKNSTAPFHDSLEKINQCYLKETRDLGISKVNNNFGWGISPEEDSYKALTIPTLFFTLTNEKNEIDAFLKGSLFNGKDMVLQLTITQNPLQNNFRNYIKKLIGKKFFEYYQMDQVNKEILETLIVNFRNHPYQYAYDQVNRIIVLKIKF